MINKSKASPPPSYPCIEILEVFLTSLAIRITGSHFEMVSSHSWSSVYVLYESVNYFQKQSLQSLLNCFAVCSAECIHLMVYFILNGLRPEL